MGKLEEVYLRFNFIKLKACNIKVKSHHCTAAVCAMAQQKGQFSGAHNMSFIFFPLIISLPCAKRNDLCIVNKTTMLKNSFSVKQLNNFSAYHYYKAEIRNFVMPRLHLKCSFDSK